MNCHKSAHSWQNTGFFRYGAAIFCAAFILVFSGCEVPDDTDDTTQKQDTVPVASDFNITGLGPRFFNGTPQSVNITPKDGKSTGNIKIYYKDGIYYSSETAPSTVGSYTVTFDVSSAPGWNEVKELLAGEMSIIEPTDIISLNIDTWADGIIESLDSEQWFMFTATENPQYIHFDSSTLPDVLVQLYNNTGVWIERQQNLSGDSLYTFLTPGNVYYIKVTGNYRVGEYKIGFNASTIPPLIDLPTTGITTLSAGSWADGDISDSGDRAQWFKFTATADTQYIHFDPGTLFNVYLQLYDNTGKKVEEQPNLSTKSYTLTSGNEYFIRVTNYYNSGSYRITFSALPMPPNTDITALSANIWANGNIAASNGAQWFKFTATADTQYIYFEHGTISDVYVQLYDSDGTTVGSKRRLYSGSFSQTLTSGNEYYMEVTPYSTWYSGAYKIGVSALPMPPNTNITTLSADTLANGNIAASNGAQWFKFTATADTQYIHFEPDALSDVYVQLYDSNGAAVESQTRLYSSIRSTSMLLTSGNVYYIKVTPYSTWYSGAYKIGVSALPIPPNTNITTLTVNTWVNGNKTGSGGSQWYKFTATADNQFIYFSGNMYNIYVQLYNSNGVIVGGQSNISSGSILYKLTSGNEYFVRVTTSSDYGIAFGAFFISSNMNVTVLSADTWTDGNIASSGDSQWYKFTATADNQYIHFERSPTLPTVSIQLYNSGGETVGNQTNLSDSAPYTSLMLTSGNEYYIRVMALANSYSSGVCMIGFTTSTTPPTKIILPNSNITLVSANTWVNGNITNSGSQWFYFTASANNQYIHFAPGTLSDVYVQLYDTTGTAVGNRTRLYSDGALYTSILLTSGNVYYIKVRPTYIGSNSNSGAYRIGFTELFVPPTNIISLNVDTWGGGNITASIYYVQWFRFTATADNQYIHFAPGTLSDVHVQLYNSNGETVGSQTSLGNSWYFTTYTTRTLTSGNVYYIKVTPVSTNSTGTYRIGFTELFIPPPAIIPLNPDTWAYGNITASNDNVQWFKFTATANNQYIHFAPGTLSYVNVQLYNSNGETVGSQTSLGNSTLFTTRTLTSGNLYYIKVSSSSIGAYKIGFNGLPKQPEVPVGTLDVNTWYGGTLSRSYEENWFKFTATAAVQYIHFFTDYYNPKFTKYVYVQLYDSNGATVGSQRLLSLDNLYTSLTLTSGNVYYIKVMIVDWGNNYSEYAGEYMIGFNTSTTPPP